MNKHYLQSKIKSTGTAYLFFLFLGAHYAYLGKWGMQFLYWITLGGFLVWMIIDLFTLPSKVANHNAEIFRKIEAIEKKEKANDRADQIAMINAIKKQD